MSKGKWPNSLGSKLKAFFEANPDEELCYSDLLAKFPVDRKTAMNAVQALCKRGVLESVHVIRRRQKGIARDAATETEGAGQLDPGMAAPHAEPTRAAAARGLCGTAGDDRRQDLPNLGHPAIGG